MNTTEGLIIDVKSKSNIEIYVIMTIFMIPLLLLFFSNWIKFVGIIWSFIMVYVLFSREIKWGLMKNGIKFDRN